MTASAVTGQSIDMDLSPRPVRSHLLALVAFLSTAAGCTQNMDLGGVPSGSGGQPSHGSGGVTGGAAGSPGGLGGACVLPLDTANCGNGVLDRGEACDDGNTQSGDGCTSLCQIEAGWSCGVAGQACVRAVCGDGAVEPGEACDDGNTTSGDGCAADCLSVEQGWRCPTAGMPCGPICGDGLIEGGETCDDGNTLSADGCSRVCQIEPGATCAGQPSLCYVATCGNGVVETGESCDLGQANGLFHGDGTGCSSTCTREPKCLDGSGQSTACPAVCGDGIVQAGEACGGGNQRGGDRCSSTCTPEAGFSCVNQPRAATTICSQPGHSGTCLQLPVTYRDFKSEHEAGGHPDFYYLGTADSAGNVTRWCVPDASGPARQNDATARCWSVAGDTLLNGKPQLGSGAAACACQFTDVDSDTNGGHVPNYDDATDDPLRTKELTAPGEITQVNGHPRWTGTVKAVDSAASFAGWFTDGGSSTATTTARIELAQVSAGRYRFASAPNVVTGGYFPFDPMSPQTAAPAGEPLLCNLYPYWSSSFPSCQGDQFLYPPSVDPASAACTASPSDCALGLWVPNVSGVRHDFWFTQEMHLPFVLTNDGIEVQVIATDDLFVFLNGQLVMDLGGTHQRIPGYVSVDSTGNASIVEGGSVGASGYINSCPTADPLTGVAATIGADCRTRTINLGLQVGQTYELAIFGANRHPTESNFDLMLTGFDGAAPISVCAPLCGDGVIEQGEACDDGTLNDDAEYGGCTTACQLGPRCGDGNQDIGAGEQCDLGNQNTTAYTSRLVVGACSPSCQLPHFCGDGTVDSAYGEECDDGSLNGAAPSFCGALACSTTCQVTR